ncbi:MAG TPA: ABC transporter permease [bacterium]|nr:ABC transporter permease [bacterium]
MTHLRRTAPLALVRFIVPFGLALVVFALVLLIAGKNPIKAYADVIGDALASSYGFSEVLVRMIPLLLTALAAAIPARIWLINIGGEGQLYIGALAATWVAITFPDLPSGLLLSVMVLAGFVGGGAWASIAGVMRARGWVSETISTLLLNYVAVRLVSFFVFGMLRDPESANYPQSVPFVDAARLPAFFGSRVHLGIVFALAALLVFHFTLTRTRWGLEIRATGGNPAAARRSGVPIGRYIFWLMFVGGGMAGLAGMTEVSAIQGRLVPGLSPGYGFAGFLVSWIALGNPLALIAAAFLLAIITSGGDILQIAHALPGAVVNILMALILFVVLARRGRAAGGAA